MNAPKILTAAAGHLEDRASAYDSPQGERSAAKTAAAFNAVTGHALTPSDVYLLLAVLKMVRARQGAFKMDNYEDGAAYFALAGEADQQKLTETPRTFDRNPVTTGKPIGTSTPTPNVFWQCPHCNRKHEWSWYPIEAEETGPIGMICDLCESETTCRGDGKGNFTPA